MFSCRYAFKAGRTTSYGNFFSDLLAGLNTTASTLLNELANDDQSSKADSGSGDVASIVNAIQGSVSAKDPIAMLDALKQIGGSGTANIATLVNVAKMTATENVDNDLVQSIGTSGNTAIYSVLQNAYSASSRVALYLHQPT